MLLANVVFKLSGKTINSSVFRWSNYLVTCLNSQVNKNYFCLCSSLFFLNMKHKEKTCRTLTRNYKLDVTLTNFSDFLNLFPHDLNIVFLLKTRLLSPLASDRLSQLWLTAGALTLSLCPYQSQLRKVERDKKTMDQEIVVLTNKLLDAKNTIDRLEELNVSKNTLIHEVISVSVRHDYSLFYCRPSTCSVAMIYFLTWNNIKVTVKHSSDQYRHNITGSLTHLLDCSNNIQ